MEYCDETEENEQPGGEESQTTGISNSESPASLSQPVDQNNEREDGEREDDEHPLIHSVSSLPGGESSTLNVSQAKKNS